MVSLSVDRGGPPEPGEPPAYRAPIVERRKLGNGLDVWIVERHAAPLVAVRLVLDAGALREPADRAGLAVLSATMLAEGTATRAASAIAAALGDLGAEIQHAVTSDAAVLALSVHARKLEGTIEVLADMVRNPGFPEDAFGRVRGQQLAAILAAADRPQTLATRSLVARVYGEDHPYGRPVAGTSTTVAGLTAADARAFHRDHYRPDNAALIVVGDVRASDLIPTLERFLGDWKPGGASQPPAPAAPTGASGTAIHLIDRPGSSQSELRVGRLAVARADGAFAPLTLLNGVLGGYPGRLWQSLREDRGYTYAAGSELDARRFAGMFIAYTAVQTDVTAEALALLLGEIRAISADRPVMSEELDFTRRRLLGEQLMAAETSAQIAARLQDLVLNDLPADHYETLSEEIRRLTVEDVARVLAERLPPEPLAIVVVGDRSRIEEPLRGLGIPLRIVERPASPAGGGIDP